MIKGLARLEYRGYDSAGIAVRDGAGEVNIYKQAGKLQALKDLTDDGNLAVGTCGIGHTRWATHGGASKINAHPHYSDDKNVVTVHNGIIENYHEIKEELSELGYTFYSQTDTEIIAKLIDHYLKSDNKGPVCALIKTMERLRGSYALAVLFRDYPQEIFVARKDSPLVVGRGKDGGVHLASDVTVLLEYTNEVYYLDNFMLGRLNESGVKFYGVDGKERKLLPETVALSLESVDQSGYRHYMIKEINEQPAAIQKTLDSFVKKGKIDFSAAGLTDDVLRAVENIRIVACGSAYHVGAVLQYVIEETAGIGTGIDLASEFRYRNPLVDGRTLVIVISQSGETADTLAALREAKARGAKTLAIVNVRGSAISREADFCAYTEAGPEIAVATTKAYSAQLIVGYLFAIALGRIKNKLDEARARKYLEELYALPEKVQSVLKNDEKIRKIAGECAYVKSTFFMGRGIDYAICMESSLKLKEITYTHCEAYAAGELKHGTISLMEKGVVAFGILTQPHLLEKTVGNLKEVDARDAKIIAITTGEPPKCAAECILLPAVEPLFAANVAVVAMQLFSYYVSLTKGLDPDKPRNLAKSVTVE